MKYRVMLILGSLTILAFLSIGDVRLSAKPEETAVDAPHVDSYVATAAQGLTTTPIKYQISSSTPQFVIFSFDGSKSVEILNEILSFQKQMIERKKPVYFTFFINAAYLLTKENSELYSAPEGSKGRSQVGFSYSTQDIAKRVKGLNTAFTEKNEIGSHTAGHFTGTDWSYNQWKQEFESFNSILANVIQNNPNAEDIDYPIFLSKIKGFRAPNLGANSNLYKILKDFNFRYDSSGAIVTDSWPQKDENNIWHIPLSMVNLGNNRAPVIAMDYNLWTRQSGAVEMAIKGTPLWDEYLKEIEEAYMNRFDLNYNENRGPVVVANHFSKWNDGVYWEAMKSFADNVCGRQNVRCVTFSELVDYLDTTGAPPII